ncbi:MAG TPA: DUF4190 domain-containing protein [Mycobacteriales bacterium]|nr:DUF4190 domain-containing protein [Mycobacteriales bacterium]
MFGSKDRHDDDHGSTRVDRDHDHAHGTTTDADVTSRMTGTRARHAGDHDHDGVADSHERTGAVATAGPDERYEERRFVRPAKTSAAAAFALVFGVAALFTALTAILAPVAVVLGLIGLILGIAGIKMSRRVGVTGKGVAIGGLVTALLGLLLGAAVIAGAAVFVNDEQNLDRLEGWIEDVRNDLPSGNDIVEEIPGS